MKYVDEFRDRELAEGLAAAIRHEAHPSRRYNIMEFCGGHTHAIFRYGVQELMPENVNFVHGPGCPVCVLPVGRVDNALELAERHGVILCSYGDMLRVPASNRRSLLKAKAEGADVRMVYSIEDALNIARQNPGREVVFFAIGFETTTPPSAVAIRKAKAEGLSNFSLFCNHVLTPPPSSTSSKARRCAPSAASPSMPSWARRMSAPSSAASPTSFSPRNSSGRSRSRASSRST